MQTNNTLRPPVSSNVGRQATIQINRGGGALQTLGGKAAKVVRKLPIQFCRDLCESAILSARDRKESL